MMSFYGRILTVAAPCHNKPKPRLLSNRILCELFRLSSCLVLSTELPFCRRTCLLKVLASLFGHVGEIEQEGTYQKAHLKYHFIGDHAMSALPEINLTVFPEQPTIRGRFMIMVVIQGHLLDLLHVER